MSAMPGVPRFYPLVSLFLILSFISLMQNSANGRVFLYIGYWAALVNVPKMTKLWNDHSK